MTEIRLEYTLIISTTLKRDADNYIVYNSHHHDFEKKNDFNKEIFTKKVATLLDSFNQRAQDNLDSLELKAFARTNFKFDEFGFLEDYDTVRDPQPVSLVIYPYPEEKATTLAEFGKKAFAEFYDEVLKKC